MAQTYTITKMVTLSPSSTVSKIGSPFEDPNALGTYYQLYGSGTTGRTDGRFSFTEIPANATITNVSAGIRTTGSSLGSGGTEYFSLLDEGGQNIGVFNKDVIIDYLQTGARKFSARCSYTSGQTTKQSSTLPFAPTLTLSRTSTFTVTITYEVAAATTVNYGTGEGWVPCAVHYCDGNAYKPCRVFYGKDGEWVEIG